MAASASNSTVVNGVKCYSDPSKWPPRPTGGQWGDPKAPRYNYGPSCWSPWDQDMNWREQCRKETDKYFQRKDVEAMRAAGPPKVTEIETKKHLFGGDTARSTKAILARVKTQEDLKRELVKEMTSLASDTKEMQRKYAEELQLRLATEMELQEGARLNKEMALELDKLKRRVGSTKFAMFAVNSGLPGGTARAPLTSPLRSAGSVSLSHLPTLPEDNEAAYSVRSRATGVPQEDPEQAGTSRTGYSYSSSVSNASRASRASQAVDKMLQRKRHARESARLSARSQMSLPAAALGEE